MSLYHIFVIIALSNLLVYALYLLRFYTGLKKSSPDLNYKKRTVSVVIAARNEEKNIGQLLTSLVNQSYPKELFEIIIADDRSSDKTSRIVEQFAERWHNIRLVKIEKTPPKTSPKKHALSQAINCSKGEVILLTDADCLVTKYWIESMVSNFTADISMVAGFSRIHLTNWRRSSLLHKFEYFDFLLIFMAAAGAILSGKYFSCSNQNLAYLRSAYEKVGGFSKIKHLLSGDDVNLMQLFRKNSMKVSFSTIKHSFVYTQPVRDFRQLISQRSRWASNAKWQLSLNPEFFLYLLSVFSLHLSILIILFLNWRVALLIFAVKAFSEFIFVSSFFTGFEQERKRLAFFPVWSLIQPFYMLIVTVRGMFELFSWK